MSRKYDCYISGRMRGLPNDNRELFDLVASKLRAEGYSVYNPAEKNMDGKKSFAFCIKQDLYAIMHKCKNVVALPGWRESEGATLEILCALNCGIPVSEISIQYYAYGHNYITDAGFDFSYLNKKPYTDTN